MQPVICGVATLAIAGIFYTFRSYQDMLIQKQRVLRERVTYMLWVMAGGVENEHSTSRFVDQEAGLETCH
jgi:hypothetical protein